MCSEIFTTFVHNCKTICLLAGMHSNNSTDFSLMEMTTEQITIKIEYLNPVNYTLFHNHIPVCESCMLTNETENALSDIVLSCDSEYFTHSESMHIPSLGAGGSVVVKDFDIIPHLDTLAKMTERISTQFTLKVTAGGETIYEKNYPIDLLPHDFWTGSTILPQTLTSFITPNHPAINALILQTAEILKRNTGSSGLTEYQSGNPNEVRNQVAAAFAAIHKQGIVYRAMPASYEETGQRVTLPDQVLASKLGNCIELTLLMATLLEAIGINTVIVLQKGHAYLGVWLVDDCYPCSVCDDASFIEKKCSDGINEMLVLECTAAAGEKASFEDAVATAERNLADHSLFELFIDVKRARLERIRPLPARINTDGQWLPDAQGVGHDSCVINVEEHDRYDLSRLADTRREPTKFDIWERKLLDFSLRNQLLNISLRRRAIQFISFDIDRIEDHLQDGQEYVISPKPEVEFRLDTSERLVRSKLFAAELGELIRNDIEHHRLHTYQTPGETSEVAKNIYRGARNAIEETGANSLFLAIGTLRWFETPQSETPRYAPILLLPVEMVRKKGNYYIRTRDEEITLNITLVEFLRQNYDIRFKGLETLPADDHGVDVRLIFAIIRDALHEQKRWDVEEECILGTFSFSKFLMWNDIHTHRDRLMQNSIVGSLVANRLTWTPEPVTANLRNIDASVSPSEIALPVAADSSQMAAVIEAGRAHSFILYGPPGTGKSQTITNLIANALYQGKRVLFVAEKMAALSVVQSRLAKIGLEPFCLELHSNKSTKQHVLRQLHKALNVAHILPLESFMEKAGQIFEKRKALIAYMDALHSVDRSDGLSLYDCILRYESLPGEPLDAFSAEPALDVLLSKEGVEGVEEVLGGRFETVLKLVGQPSKNPFNGLRLTRQMLQDTDSLIVSLRQAAQLLAEESERASELADTALLREKILRNYSPEILGEDGEQLNRQWREAKSKWFLPRYFAKKAFIRQMKRFSALITEADIEPLIDRLISYRSKHDRIEAMRAVLLQYLNVETSEDRMPDPDMLLSVSVRLARWSNNPAGLRDWLHWSEFCDDLAANGMGCVATALSKKEYTAAELRRSYLKALLKHKTETKIHKSDSLAAFEGMLFDEKVNAYKRMTEEFQLLTQKELYARLASQIPHVADDIRSGSEIGILNRNISNGGRGISLRDLFELLPTLLPRLCPCMLMSPMSVAQYIDLSGDKFDLVIFDEASQMSTCEAIGAIARGKSLIVVGDPRQMPPTSFFSSTNVGEEEATIDDMESILEDCRTLEMPALQLSWHYRSRHESLIAFSNNEYYDGSLITFPSVDDRSTKVHHVSVQGTYDKGGRRQNRAEAEAIVGEIRRRLSDPALCRRSIGVIAFSVVQQSLIEDMLQDMLDNNRQLREAAEAMYEPVFVKNLENVQGDERDVILFSIGYGPDKSGKVSMNFGPLNNAGGERRLNVAVSRAREEMYVFSTLRSSDIDLRRSKARGVEGLKHFLEFAETQSLASVSQNTADGGDAQIALQIAAVLRDKGYDASVCVGRSKFKVDIAVGRHDAPATYCLGILLDGIQYRDTPTTRDREIVQPSVLASLHWQIMRVWSVDWFNNPDRVIARIEERLAEVPAGDNTAPARPAFDISAEPVSEKPTMAADYTRAELPADADAHGMDDAALIRLIVTAEQPVTVPCLCRRFCEMRGLTRVSPTVQRDVNGCLGLFYKDNTDTVWLSESDRHNYANYRPCSDRDIASIPQIELINAMKEVLAEQVAVDEDTLRLAGAKKLGFTRRGSNVEEAFLAALAAMKAAGDIESVGNNIRLTQNNR